MRHSNRERRRTRRGEHRTKSPSVGAAIDIFGLQSELIATQHDRGMDVDGVERRLLGRDELLCVLEGQDLGRVVRHLRVVHERRRDGFGAVVGSKNLKAISVVGTGSVEIADPIALFNARMLAKDEFGAETGQPAPPNGPSLGRAPSPTLFFKRKTEVTMGPQACQGCIAGCRPRWSDGLANESSCQETGVYTTFDALKHGAHTDASVIATDLVQRYGVNSYELA